LSTLFGQTATNNAWEKWDDDTWHDFPEVYQAGNLRIHIYPLVSEVAQCGPSLPVSWGLIQAKAEGNTNLLRWESLTEDNNAGFEIQRSTDGARFSTLDFEPSKATNGYSVMRQQYAFVDKQPQGNRQYYRLVQLDRDGKKSFSTVVKVDRNRKLRTMVLASYPNPVKAQLLLEMPDYPGQELSTRLTDLAGKLYWQGGAKVDAAGNARLQLGGLPKGVYLLHVQGKDGRSETVKLVKE
jgi:hypothetical protein